MAGTICVRCAADVASYLHEMACGRRYAEPNRTRPIDRRGIGVKLSEEALTLADLAYHRSAIIDEQRRQALSRRTERHA